MLQFSVIGNLGADAHVEESNGRKFVSFNVGHNESWLDAAGNSHERTQWISCALNGDGGGLLQYLVKGRSVFVQGRGSARVYSSPKERKMVAGLNLSVDRIELIGGQPDAVPRQLVDGEGQLFSVYKAFYLLKEDIKALGVSKDNNAELMTPDGRVFTVDKNGWVTPSSKDASQHVDVAGNSDENK